MSIMNRISGFNSRCIVWLDWCWLHWPVELLSSLASERDSGRPFDMYAHTVQTQECTVVSESVQAVYSKVNSD